MTDIEISEYIYDLPPERIAQYPSDSRDQSKLLVSEGEELKEDIFRNIGNYIPINSLLVFNNTRVIRARLLFRKESGAEIEILCLEPLYPAGYEMSLSSQKQVEWKCIVGNLKKWKQGALCREVETGGQHFTLFAEKAGSEGEALRVRFRWEGAGITFSEVLDAAGHTPLPPYITREDGEADRTRYQTVYSSIDGSVAAPTAGLHFTEQLIENLETRGIKKANITLHVGAGTFRPVKSDNISGHEMHCEHFFVTSEALGRLVDNTGNILAVGTTSVRTLESLYWLGVRLINQDHMQGSHVFHICQWEPYETGSDISTQDALMAVKNAADKNGTGLLEASTSLIIIPGYKFRVINGMITNFHQPGSTLLLLVSAWVGENWKSIYRYALDNNFRFLSYGDSSLLL